MIAQDNLKKIIERAEKYAKENAIPFIDGKELLEFSKVN